MSHTCSNFLPTRRTCFCFNLLYTHSKLWTWRAPRMGCCDFLQLVLCGWYQQYRKNLQNRIFQRSDMGWIPQLKMRKSWWKSKTAFHPHKIYRGAEACRDGLAVMGRSATQWLFSILLNSYSSFNPHRLLIWACAFTFVVAVQEGITTGTWHSPCISKFSAVAALCHVIVAGSLPAKTLLHPKAPVPVSPLSAHYCSQQLKVGGCFQTRLLLVPNC